MYTALIKSPTHAPILLWRALMGLQDITSPDKCYAYAFTYLYMYIFIVFIHEPPTSKPQWRFETIHVINLRQFLQFISHKEKFHC